MLGHGPTEGPYTELDGLDDRARPALPGARDRAVLPGDVERRASSTREHEGDGAQIKKVYGKGDYVGSLVVPTGARPPRPTNWDGVSPRPPGVTMQDFPGLMQRWNDGKTGCARSRRTKRAF